MKIVLLKKESKDLVKSVEEPSLQLGLMLGESYLKLLIESGFKSGLLMTKRARFIII